MGRQIFRDDYQLCKAQSACEACHAGGGVWGHAPPGKILKNRPAENESESIFITKMLCVEQHKYACIFISIGIWDIVIYKHTFAGHLQPVYEV